MKKILQISLARTPFTLEEDAYGQLDLYLESIRNLFRQVEGREDILADIEGRVAERFLESGKAIITLIEVEQVITSMGRAEEYQESTNTNQENSSSESLPKSSKKFYRDPQGALIGGVCTGIASYFDVEVLWVRVAFVIAAFANGLGLIAYPILWLITPEAKTPSRRLEMKGTPVTLGALKETAEENIKEFQSSTGKRLKVALEEIFSFTIKIARTGTGIFLSVGSVFLILLLSVIVPFLLTNPSGPYFPVPITDIIPLSLFWEVLAVGSLLILFPAIFILLLGINLLRKPALSLVRVGSVLFAGWCLALISGSIVTAKIVPIAQNHPLFEGTTKNLSLVEPFSTVRIQKAIRLTLVQGTEPSLKVHGRLVDINRLKMEINDDALTLSTQNYQNACLFCLIEPIEVELTLPTAKELVAEEGANLIVNQWIAANTLMLETRTGATLEAQVDAPEVQAEAENGSRIFLNGAIDLLQASGHSGGYIALTSKGKSLTLIANEGSIIDAGSAIYTDTKALAEEESTLSIGTTQTLEAEAKTASFIWYTGNPKRIEKRSEEGEIQPMSASELTEASPW